MTNTENDEAIETGLEHLERIETELEEIKDRTANPSRSLLMGILSGAGAVLGSILALIILGWLLSLLGVIPGFSSITTYLHSVVDRFNTRY